MKKFILLCLLLIPMIGFAQSYSINWYKVAGGGGTSTNGQYTLNGTIGQHDASGPMTGGGYSLSGGFWAFLSVVQTPGAPPLYIRLSGSTIIVYWQNVSPWSLYQNSSLSPGTSWTSSSGVVLSTGTNSLSITSPTGDMFFRLQH